MNRRRIAYLCGMYPAVSLTFIAREIEALRGLGTDVLTCSIRRTPPEQHPGPVEQAHAGETFNVLPATLDPLRLGRALVWALARPKRFGAMLALAWRTGGPGLRAAALQAAYTLEAVVLARHLDQNRVEHLHNHFVSASCTVAMLAARLAGVSFSWTLHGPTDFIEPLRWRIDAKVAEASFVACISHYARAQAMMLTSPDHWEKLKIVRCGIAPDFYDRPRPARPGAPLELLFVGRLARVKGLPVLFEALADLPDLRLKVIGGGPDRQALIEAAAPLGDRVSFPGNRSQDDVADALTRTDIFVLPSFAEGVPVVLMEAMASRVPVIATRVAGVAELIEDGVSGALVNPGDAEGLARAIRRMADNHDGRTAMGDAGRQKVTADFEIGREAEGLLGYINAAAQARD